MLQIRKIIKIGEKFFTNTEIITVTKSSRSLVDLAEVKLNFNNRIPDSIINGFEDSVCKIYAGYQNASSMNSRFKTDGWFKSAESIDEEVEEYFNGRTVVKEKFNFQGCNLLFEGVVDNVNVQESSVILSIKSKIWTTSKILLQPKVYSGGLNLTDLLKDKVKFEITDLVKEFLNITSYDVFKGDSVYGILDTIHNYSKAHIFYKGDTLYINGAYTPYEQEKLINFSGTFEKDFYPYEHYSLPRASTTDTLVTLNISGPKEKDTFSVKGKGENVTYSVPDYFKLTNNGKKYTKQIQLLRSVKDASRRLKIWLVPFIQPNSYVLVKKYYLNKSVKWSEEKKYTNPEEKIFNVSTVSIKISKDGAMQTLSLEDKILK